MKQEKKETANLWVCTACFSDTGEGLPTKMPCWTETPLDRDPTWKKHGTKDRDLPRRNMGSGSETGSDIIQRPPL